jgi:hypothetical protein
MACPAATAEAAICHVDFKVADGEGFRMPAVTGRASGHEAGVRKLPKHEPRVTRAPLWGFEDFGAVVWLARGLRVAACRRCLTERAVRERGIDAVRRGWAARSGRHQRGRGTGD